MATYYWVGGSGTWDNSDTTNWAASSGGAGGSGPPLAADNVVFDANSGTAATVTVAATAVCTACTVNKSDINLSLSGSPTFSGTLTLTTGTVTLNSSTLTVQIFSSANTNARSIAFGTGKIVVTGNGATVLDMNDATNYSYTGTPRFDLSYSGSTGTRTVRFGDNNTANAANVFDLYVTAGSDIVRFVTGTASTAVRTLDTTNFSGTIDTPAIRLFGSINLSATTTITATTNAITFLSTQTGNTITTNGVTIDRPVTFNGVGGSWQLQDNLTIGSTKKVTLTNGTLDLFGKTLSTGLFNSDNSNTRSILFGGGNITLTGNADQIWVCGTLTNFSYTGTPIVNCSYSGATGTRTITHGTTVGGAESNAISFNVTAGTDSFAIVSSALEAIKDLNFTGFAGTFSDSGFSIYGSLTVSTGMTVAAGSGTTIFAGTSGTQTFTTNGKTYDRPIRINGVGANVELGDALTQGSTRAFTLTNGTFNAKNQNVTIGTFALGAGTKTLTLGGGTWTVAGSGASAWNANTNVSGLTVSASTGTISMTSGSAKTFSGGGLTWPTLNQGGAGALTIAQSNTFANITNTVQPATVRLTAGTTQTVSALSLAGTSGNLITLDTTVAGTKATIYKATGSVSLSFVSIKDISATGGANFNAFTSNGCVDGGNNTGWDFNSALYPTIYTVRKTKRYFLN